MPFKTGIIQVYLKSSQRKETYIVGDEEGLYRLWEAVGEAMVSKRRQGSAKVRLVDGCRYQITTLRVDQRSHFLRRFHQKGHP